MNEKQIEMITNYLDKIGEKLGVGANTIWPWLVKQQYIDAIIFFSCCVFFWSSAIWIYKKWQNKWQDEVNTNDPGVLDITRIILSIVIGITTLITTVHFFVEGFDIFNPQYWALRDLLQMVR